MMWAIVIALLIVLLPYLMFRRWYPAYMGWYWAGAACYLGWGGFLAWKGLDMTGYWMLIDAPLNFGWILCWSYPMLQARWAWSRSRQSRRRAFPGRRNA